MMKLIYLVLAMGIVTYLPRMLPLVLLQNVKLPKRVNSFMRFVPFAALGALIFPGILSSAGADKLTAAMVGSIVSLVLAYMNVNLVLVVLGGIVGVYVTTMFF